MRQSSRYHPTKLAHAGLQQIQRGGDGSSSSQAHRGGSRHGIDVTAGTLGQLGDIAGEFAQFVSVWGGGRDGIVEMLKVDLSPTELWTYTTNPDERNARARVARLKPEWPMVLVVAYLAQQHPRGLTAESRTEIDESLLTDLSAATAAA